jgi:hypothetical protein
MKYTNKQFWIALILILTIGTVLCIAGCETKPASELQQAATPIAALTKSVASINWLAALGILVCAAGVYAFITGNNLGTAIIGAGATIAGGGIAYAIACQLLEDWTKYAVWILPVMGVLAAGAYIWGHYEDTVNSNTLKKVKVALASSVEPTLAELKLIVGVK